MISYIYIFTFCCMVGLMRIYTDQFNIHVYLYIYNYGFVTDDLFYLNSLLESSRFDQFWQI